MPQFTDSNRIAIRYIKESVWASTPADETFTALPITSEGFQSNINTVTSNTIRDDRNVADITTVGGGASGDVGFELRYADWDPFIEGAMQSAFATVAVTSATASAYLSGADIVADSSTLSSVVVGQFVRVSNVSTTVNGDYRVTAVSTIAAGRERVTLVDASSAASATFPAAALSGTGSIAGKTIRNGVTATSYTIEKAFTDNTLYHAFRGMRIGTWNINFETQSILTGSFSFVGKQQEIVVSSLASAVTAATTNPVMNASGHVERIWEGGETISGVYFQNLTLSLNNNLREQPAVGYDALVGVGSGRCEITGTLRAYFEDNSVLTRFVNGTDTNFRFQVTDENGRSYIFSIPNVRLQQGTVVAGGPNEDIVQEFSWGAFIDDAGLYAFQVDVLG